MIGYSVFDWEAELAPEFGGNLYRLAWRGNELLRTPPEPGVLRTEPELYGIPVLFPPGRIDGGEFTFNGGRYRLPLNEPARNNHLHGLALRAAWKVTVQEAERICLDWSFGPEQPEYAGFPFAFELALEYRFRPECVEQEFTIRNRGTIPMPCAAGFHTVFRAPRRACIDGTDCCWEIPPPRFLPNGRTLPWDGFDPRNWFEPQELPRGRQFPATPGVHSARLAYGDFELCYEVDARYRQWCIWNRDPESGFLAVEPMTCVGDALSMPNPWEETGLFALAPGEECRLRSRLILLR